MKRWKVSGIGRRRAGALVLGLTALAAAGGSFAAAPAGAAIPQFDVFAINAPDPQPEYGTGRGPANPNSLGTAFGERIRSIGDVNGDGARDILVTNTHFDVGALADVGRVWIFSGRTRALLQTIDHPDPQASSQFGFWAARLGDVDGDGVADWVTSAPSEVVNNVKQGRVYEFSGRTGALIRRIDHPDAPQLNGDFGGNIIAPGDLNGDGVSDFVATSSGAFGGIGAAYAFNGSTGAVLYRVQYPDNQAGSAFGFGASEDGDVNGDGVGDYQVGAPRFDEGTAPNVVADVGRSYTINGKTGAVLYTLKDPDVQPNARFGQADADGIAPGDINGDGRNDIFVDGFLQNDGSFISAGAAYLFNGADGQLIRPLRDPNPVASGSFAASDAPAGDLDGDGRPDLLVSSRGGIGKVTVFGGPNLTSVLTSFADPQAQQDALYGTGLAYPGDVNGDGQPDYFISSRSADIDGTPNIGIVWAYISQAPPRNSNPNSPVNPSTPTKVRIGPKAARPRVRGAVQRRRERVIRATVAGGLTATQGRSCAGAVRIRIRVGSRSVGTARTTMKSNCRFTKSTRVRVSSLASRLRPRSRRVVLRVSYRFLGNGDLLPASSPTASKRVKR